MKLKKYSCSWSKLEIPIFCPIQYLKKICDTQIPDPPTPPKKTQKTLKKKKNQKTFNISQD